MTTKEPAVLFEGSCAYALATKAGYEIRVFSSNSVTHVAAGTAQDATKAARVCKGLNLYPRQSRAFHGLL